MPALAGIMLTLDADVQGVVLVEADAADACPPIDARPAGVEVRDVRRIPGSPGAALADALADWATEHAVAAVADGPRFAAWIAAESTAVPALRAAVATHGVDPGRTTRRATGARPVGGRPRRRSSVRVASPTSLDAGAAVETPPLERRPP